MGSKRPKEFADPIDEVLDMLNQTFRKMGYKTHFQRKKRMINFRAGCKAENEPPLHCRLLVEYNNYTKPSTSVIKFGFISGGGTKYSGPKFKLFKMGDISNEIIHSSLDPVKIVDHCDKVIQYLKVLPEVFGLQADPDEQDDEDYGDSD